MSSVSRYKIQLVWSKKKRPSSQIFRHFLRKPEPLLSWNWSVYFYSKVYWLILGRPDWFFEYYIDTVLQKKANACQTSEFLMSVTNSTLTDSCLSFFLFFLSSFLTIFYFSIIDCPMCFEKIFWLAITNRTDEMIGLDSKIVQKIFPLGVLE